MQHQLPTMFQSSGGVAEGGLMSYAPSWADPYRRAAYYVDRILRGRPAVQRFCAALEDPVTRDALIELGFSI